MATVKELFNGLPGVTLMNMCMVNVAGVNSVVITGAPCSMMMMAANPPGPLSTQAHMKAPTVPQPGINLALGFPAPQPMPDIPFAGNPGCLNILCNFLLVTNMANVTMSVPMVSFTSAASGSPVGPCTPLP
jgi:hypothetical protein